MLMKFARFTKIDDGSSFLARVLRGRARLGLRFQGLQFRVQGLGLGFRVQGLGLGFRL